MKVFLYSSPYKYYMENLYPIALELKSQGHDVASSYSLKNDSYDSEYDMLDNKKVTYSKSFVEGTLKVDCVILTQPWWYIDNKIAQLCRIKRIPFYIIDHAPPMIAYTDQKGTKSHLYRTNLLGCRAFFAYGSATDMIMKLRGCRENIVPIGSPRIERYLSLIKNDKFIKNCKQQKKQIGKKILTLFDTSNKMEDKNLYQLVIELKKQAKDYKFIVRPHSRSTSIYKSLSDIDVDFDEEEIALMSDVFVFTFPSSAMLLPAILNKPIVSIYSNHFCEEAKIYAKETSNTILSFPEYSIEDIQNKSIDYSDFLTKNLANYKFSPTKKIIQFILKDLK